MSQMRKFSYCPKSLMLRPEHMYFRASLVIVEDVRATTPWIMRCFMRSITILNERVRCVLLMSYFNAHILV